MSSVNEKIEISDEEYERLMDEFEEKTMKISEDIHKRNDIFIDDFDIEEEKKIAISLYLDRFPKAKVKNFDEDKIKYILFNHIFYQTKSKYMSIFSGYSKEYKIPKKVVFNIFKDKFIYLLRKKYVYLESICNGYYGS